MNSYDYEKLDDYIYIQINRLIVISNKYNYLIIKSRNEFCIPPFGFSCDCHDG